MDAWFCEFYQIFLVDLVGTGMMRAFWDDFTASSRIKEQFETLLECSGNS